MSDHIPYPNEDYPDTSPEANACANYLYTIRDGTHPAIVAGDKAYHDALCATGYFCCGPCDCEAIEEVYGGGEVEVEACGGPNGCKAWWTPRESWWPIVCGVDPCAKQREDTLRPIDEAHERAVGREARIRLAGNCALSLSNTRLSSIFYNSMLDSAESILVGMTNTFLQAGAIAGAVAGASMIFSSTMSNYAILANGFIQSFEPYNPPPITGGGGRLS